MYLATAVTAVLQFGMTAVLARLLTPTAFGLIAFAGVFLRFVNYFAKAGITQALVQKPRLRPEDVRAAFALSTGLGLVFSLVVFVAAPFAAAVGQDPELIPVLRWLTVGLVINGLGAPSTALLRRDLRFKGLAGIDVVSYIVGYFVVGLGLAIAGAGVYALVGATLVQAIVAALSGYIMVQHPLLPTKRRTSYREILDFGARVSLVSFLEFLKSNLDTLAVGRWAGAAQLGVYNRANLLADLPAQRLTSGFSQVLFPSFSAIQHDPDRLRSAYLSAVGMAAAVILPLNAGMAVAARELVLVMLGTQWLAAIDVLPWLLLASALALIGHFAGIVAEAQAALNAKMVVALGSTIMLGLALWVAQGRGLPAFGGALAAAAAVSHFGYLIILTRTLDTTLKELVIPYLPALLGAAIVAASIAGCRLFLLNAGLPTGLVLGMEILVGAGSLMLTFRFGPYPSIRRDLSSRLRDAGLLRDGTTLSRLVKWTMGGTS
jgi:lipopolysaccharide exporter